MKRALLIMLFLPIAFLNAQQLGEMAPEKPREIFPDKSIGLDFMFTEGGFGLGSFFRHNLTNSLSFFTDISFSEGKDSREVEYVTYWGETYTPGKKNRIFLVPLNFGLQQRLFENVITDNLRPYINFGVGPSMIVTTPYDREFFNSFSKAQARYTLGGYIGIGANFGLDKSSLLGINIRYYEIRFFDKGVESLDGIYQKSLGGFFFTINIGIMY
ncbi:MAG: hypothetical protein C4539_13790 [Ignavibacteriales bacterium]|nr:MAG: hypothetical protein C4539_13790 [Ignavibacteriales bacterium]